jgi:beta-galactosidase/beta-glucuronidase
VRIAPAKLVVLIVVVVALFAAGTVVVAGAMAPGSPRGETLVAPAAAGGPVGRQALAGPWLRALDPQDLGVGRGWSRGVFPGDLVTVPDAANPAITGEAGLRSSLGSVAWYRTSVTAPASGAYALRFESVHHLALVWLDGRLLGRHTGAYLPFEFRLRLQRGVRHTLVVRADFRDPQEQKRAGWHRTWFNFGGLNREVTLRPLADAELVDPGLTTRLAGGVAVVRVSARVRNRTGSARDVAVSGTLTRSGTPAIPIAFPSIHLGPGASGAVAATVRVARPALWQPGSPALYDLELRADGRPAWTQAVGLRELRRRGARLYLNGRRLRLHGASLHEDARRRGDALTPADMDRMVSELRAVGANATRAQHQLSPALLERLDRAGILVWQGVGPVDAPGAWTSHTPLGQRVARERVRASVAQLRLHPSIVAWNLVNELAGNGHDETEVAYVEDMARELHRTDPGRLVAVDVWGTHAPSQPGRIYRHVDAVGLTNYIGWYVDAAAEPKVIAAAIRAATLSFSETFPDKVKIVSEFGAEANAENRTAAPGGFAYQSWLLRRHIASYRALPQLSGMLIWNLRDFAVAPSFAGGSIKRLVPDIHIVRGLNQKGLFEQDGTPKPSVAAVRTAFAPMGMGLTAK